VDAVLEGSIQRVGEKIRVTVRLLNVQDGSALWAHQSDEQQYANIFVMQDAISEEVASALALQLSREERERLRNHGTEDREAYLLYMKGRYYWNKRSAEGLQAALAHFLQAIEQDPLYAQAYIGVADCYAILGDYAVIHPREAMLKAKAVATKALELDDMLAEAHATLGFINSDFDRSISGKELQRAIELNPNYATAHHWYAMHLTFSGRFDDGIAEVLRAQELDPLSLAIGAGAGAIFATARQYDRAFEQFQKLLDMDPNFHRARQFLGLLYSWKGMHEQAIAELQKAWQADERTEVLAWLGLAYAMAGQPDKARATIAELEKLSKHRYVSPFDMAAIYTALKDNDQAFAWLEKWYEDRPARLGVIRFDPRMDALHGDPRFADLLRRLGPAP
jgi:tetratricopeptide (TPR) repeat protein